MLWTLSPEVVVLATSDKDLIPLVRVAKQRGAFVVVLGSDFTAIPLREMADEHVTYRQLITDAQWSVRDRSRAGPPTGGAARAGAPQTARTDRSRSGDVAPRRRRLRRRRVPNAKPSSRHRAPPVPHAATAEPDGRRAGRTASRPALAGEADSTTGARRRRRRGSRRRSDRLGLPGEGLSGAEGGGGDAEGRIQAGRGTPPTKLRMAEDAPRRSPTPEVSEIDESSPSRRSCPTSRQRGRLMSPRPSRARAAESSGGRRRRRAAAAAEGSRPSLPKSRRRSTGCRPPSRSRCDAMPAGEADAVPPEGALNGEAPTRRPERHGHGGSRARRAVAARANRRHCPSCDGRKRRALPLGTSATNGTPCVGWADSDDALAKRLSSSDSVSTASGEPLAHDAPGVHQHHPVADTAPRAAGRARRPAPVGPDRASARAPARASPPGGAGPGWRSARRAAAGAAPGRGRAPGCTRWRSPPDSSSTNRSARSATPAAAIAQSMARRSVAVGPSSMRAYGVRPRATISRTTMPLGMGPSWGTTAISRATSRGAQAWPGHGH